MAAPLPRCDTEIVHEAFGTVVFIVCGVAIVLALVALLTSGRTWSEYGKGGLVMDRDSGRPSPAPVAPAERDAEIRELLAARNARRARRGEAPLDVEAEFARLTAAGSAAGGAAEVAVEGAAEVEVDPSLREEVRQLVEARNHRRVRAGKPPLDVEAEVERELARVRDL